MDIQNKLVRWSDLSPRCLARTLLHNAWLIVCTAAVFAMAASLYYGVVRKPVYQASMTYAVTSRDPSYTSSSSVTASKEVTAVMTELLGTDVIAEKLAQVHGELQSFDGSIRASQVGETNLISVTAQASTPKQAFLALDALVEVFPELSDYLSASSAAQVIRNPSVSTYPINAVNERG